MHPGEKGRSRNALVCAAVIASMVIAACGSDSDSSSGSGSALEGKSVAIVGPERGDPYYEEVACGAQAEGMKLGLKVGKQQAAANQSQAQQNTIVQQVLAKRPAGLIYTPTDGKAGGLPLRQAPDDLTVINVDAKLDDAAVYEAFVASDHYEGGKQITKTLAEMIGGKGQIAAIGSLPSNPITQARIKGFEDELKNYPGIQIVSIQYPDLTPSAIQSTASSLLTKYPDLKAFYTTNFINAGGAATALRNAQKVGEVKAVSWDAGASNVKLLQQGILQATVAQQPYTMGQLAIRQIANKLEGKPIEKEITAPLSILTDKDVDSPEGKKLWYKADCAG